MSNSRSRARSAVPPILPGRQLLSVLWEGEGAPYASSESARWDLRHLRPALIEANALAFHGGRAYIHPERYAQVKERAAIEAARRRFKEAA